MTGPCGLGGLFGVCCAWPLEVEDQQKQIIVDRDDDGEIESLKSKQATRVRAIGCTSPCTH
jgi:hypothetical protein